MNARFAVVLVLLLASVAVPGVAGAADPTDKKGCVDPELFPNRMPGYILESCDNRDYDAFEFNALKGPRFTVEGKKTMVQYGWPKGNPTVSALEVARNYEAAMQKIGGTTANIRTTGPDVFMNGKIVKDGKEVWVQVNPRAAARKIQVVIVEKKVMDQRIVADAASFSNDLKSTGHTSVYGIYFDTGKAELKAESDAALQEIAKLLGNEAAMKLYVVGHTDTVGVFDENMKLSQARAESVVKALTTTHKIAAGRLKPYGVSSLAPVASNASEEGRAKNRRVELVLQ